MESNRKEGKMPTFPPQDPTGARAAPDQGLKSAEYELADQAADRALERPDHRRPPSSPMADSEDVRRGHDKLERMIAK